MRQHFRKIPFYPVFKLSSLILTNGGLSWKSTPRFLAYILKLILLEPLRLLEVFIFDHRIRKHQLQEDPIFILGYWRSGTSHLQNVMSKNPRHVTTTIFRFLFADTYYLTESWLKGPINYLCKWFGVEFKIQRSPMDMDIAAELDTEMIMYCSEYAYSWGFLFPKKYEKWMNRLLYITDEQQAQGWIEDYDYLIKKLSYWHGNKRVVVKSPGDMARFDHLLKRYPNAKFVYIERDPIEVFHSNRYLWNIIQKNNNFHQISPKEIDQHILNTYQKVMQQYKTLRPLLNTENCIEIRFPDLISHPEKTLRTVYQTLDLGPFPEDELSPFLKKNRTYKVNQYDTPPEIEAKIKAHWELVCEEDSLG